VYPAASASNYTTTLTSLASLTKRPKRPGLAQSGPAGANLLFAKLQGAYLFKGALDAAIGVYRGQEHGAIEVLEVLD